MKSDNIKALYKGAIIGGTMLVPGASGGSMAMILGIYNKLISSISSFFKDIKKNIIFLTIFIVGAVIGMIIFAKPLLNLIENYTLPMMYFFIGAVAGGVPMIYKHAQVNTISWKDILYVIIGMAIVLVLAFLPEDVFSGGDGNNSTKIYIQILSGIIAAIALVLPGISVSYMLLLMGLYDKTVRAIGHFDIGYLMPMAIGLFIGIVIITKTLEKAMDKHPRPTYLIILGFVIGSIVQVFPGLPQNYGWIICGVLAIAGYFSVSIISKNE